MPTKSSDIDTFRYLLLFIQTGRLYIFHISNPKQLKMMEIVETEKRLWGENNSGFPKDSYARSNHRQRKPQVTEPPFYEFQILNSLIRLFFYTLTFHRMIIIKIFHKFNINEHKYMNLKYKTSI